MSRDRPSPDATFSASFPPGFVAAVIAGVISLLGAGVFVGKESLGRLSTQELRACRAVTERVEEAFELANTANKNANIALDVRGQHGQENADHARRHSEQDSRITVAFTRARQIEEGLLKRIHDLRVLIAERTASRFNQEDGRQLEAALDKRINLIVARVDDLAQLVRTLREDDRNQDREIDSLWDRLPKDSRSGPTSTGRAPYGAGDADTISETALSGAVRDFVDNPVR